MAKAKAKGAAPKAAQGRSWFWLQGMICGVAAALLPGTALVTVLLLAPGLMMCAMESTPGRPIARAMILMGVATIFTPLRLLWEQGGSIEQALDVLGNPGRVLLSWCAAGMGWAVAQMAETLTKYALDLRAATASRSLTREKAELAEEWSELAENR